MTGRGQIAQVAGSLVVAIAIVVVVIVAVTARLGPTSVAELESRQDRLEERAEAEEERAEERAEAREERIEERQE